MRKFINLVEGFIDEAGAGPSRIVQHIRNGEMFIMLSGMRASLDHATNLKRTSELKAKLAQAPVSFIDTVGEFHEAGQDEPSPEMSFFILPRQSGNDISPEAFLKLGKSIMKAYDQDSIVFGDGTTIQLVERDGNAFPIGNSASFDPKVIREMPGFSKVKDRAFSFTDRDIPGAAKYGSSRKSEPKSLTNPSSMGD